MFFNDDGHFVRSIGGRGQGPGEFKSLTSVQSVPGGLVAYDRDMRRISRFDNLGVLEQTLTLGPVPGQAYADLIGMFADSTYAVRGVDPIPLSHPTGVVRQSISVFRTDQNANTMTRIGTFAGNEYFIQPYGRGGQSQSQVPFGMQSDIALHDSSFVVIDNDSSVIEYDWHGRRLRSINVRGPHYTPVPVRRSDIREARRLFSDGGSRSGELRAMFDELPIRATFPAVGWAGAHRLGILHANCAGELWVLRYGGVRSSVMRWDVYDERLQLMGRLNAPQETRILDSRDGKALLLRWNEEGAERVELRRMYWPPV